MSIVSNQEQKKISPEELTQVQKLKKDYTDLVLYMGELEMQKINIEKEKERLKQLQIQLVETENTLVKTLTEKYGKGVINAETGEIS